MAEHKIVSLTARTPLVTDPERTVAAKVDPVALATTVSKPELSTVVKDIQIDSIITGMGEENIPDPKLFKFVADSYNLSEEALKTVFKVFNTNTASADQDAKSVLKALATTLATEETVTKVWNVIRSYQDSFTKSDVLSFDNSRVSADTASTQETTAVAVSTVYSDVTNLADLTYATILVSSGKFETATTYDIIELVAEFNRSFEDTIFSTDDFYGAANIDDDQIAFVEKVLADWTALQEETRLAFTKAPFIELVTNSDVTETHPLLQKLDAVSFSDTAPVLDTEKLVPEIVATAETTALDVEPGIVVDSVAPTDEASSLVETGFTETTTNAEIVAIDAATKYVDSTTNASEITLETATSAQDTVNLPDTAELTFDKEAYTDYYRLSEPLFTKDISVLIEEYDYYSQDYFAEDDYIVHAVHATEDLVDKQINKNIINYVDATDDFLGTATLGDDEYAAVDKVLNTEYLSASDAVSLVNSFIRLVTEAVAATENVVVTVLKTLQDTASNSDQLVNAVDINREELALVTETAVLTIAPSYLDTGSVLDSYSADANKALLETAATQEQVAKTTETTRVDAASLQEAVTTVFAAIRGYEDAVNSTDSQTLLFNKNEVELVQNSEYTDYQVVKPVLETLAFQELQVFVIEQTLLDLVDATDDFYGAANIDDDQIASVDKTLADYATNAEVISTETVFLRQYLETSNLSETVDLVNAKTLLDNTSSLEAVFMIEAKVLEDSVSTPQIISLDKQSYYSQDYMELGYVGENYTY